MTLPQKVTVVEVGPRDGLQNQAEKVPTQVKVDFIDALSQTGLKVIEATSFVNPEWVPQLADAAEVMARIDRRPDIRYPVLVPNERGLDDALAAGAAEIALFASATETFSKRNLGRTRSEAMEMFRPVVKRAKEEGLRVRAYISMVLGDPWEGEVAPREVVAESLALTDLGCDELSLGDTIGVGTPGKVRRLLAALFDAGLPPERLAVHFHDTYGQGLANVLVALEMGIAIVDTSAAGLGGCPFARSATGNLATEDLVYMLDGLGIETGVDLRAVARAGVGLCKKVGIEVPGRVARAVTSEA